jgi:hypothetical protein
MVLLFWTLPDEAVTVTAKELLFVAMAPPWQPAITAASSQTAAKPMIDCLVWFRLRYPLLIRKTPLRRAAAQSGLGNFLFRRTLNMAA